MDAVTTMSNEAKLIQGANSSNLFIGTQTPPTGTGGASGANWSVMSWVLNVNSK